MGGRWTGNIIAFLKAIPESGHQTKGAAGRDRVPGMVEPSVCSLEQANATGVRTKGIAAYERRLSRRTRDRSTFPFRFE